MTKRSKRAALSLVVNREGLPEVALVRFCLNGKRAAYWIEKEAAKPLWTLFRSMEGKRGWGERVPLGVWTQPMELTAKSDSASGMSVSLAVSQVEIPLEVLPKTSDAYF